MSSKTNPRTLAIDVGGTGLKAIVLDGAGKPLTDRVRVETPRPGTPRAILDALAKLVPPLGPYDRVSVGFPGVVLRGVIRTAPNLDPSWAGFSLAKRLTRLFSRPTRVLNDAGVQGFGVVEGKGLEMVLTLGTGLGCALFIDGTYVPNLELGHHPFRKGKTYEDFLGDAALKRDGKRHWNRNLERAIQQIDPIWNPDHLYLGGGNARHIAVDLEPHVTITTNLAGLFGGIALWGDRQSALFGESTGGAQKSDARYTGSGGDSPSVSRRARRRGEQASGAPRAPGVGQGR